MRILINLSKIRNRKNKIYIRKKIINQNTKKNKPKRMIPI